MSESPARPQAACPPPETPFAATREWCVGIGTLSRYPHLRHAWRRSQRAWQTLRRELETLEPDGVETIAVSGSLGRMELLPRSDADVLVIVRDDVPVPSERAEQIAKSVELLLRSAGLRPPRSGGIYALPTTRRRLCDPARRGLVDEDLPTFGQRIQLLLDCQPLYQTQVFESLVQDVLAWYATAAHQSPGETWDYLLHDLARYFHALAVYCHGRQRDKPGKWRVRNVKRLHSRRVMQAGLLLLLGESTAEGDAAAAAAALQARLPLTPLERIAWSFERHGDPTFSTILECYDEFLRRMGDEAHRARLEAPSGEGTSRDGLEANPEYRQLQANARRMTAELVRFLWQRRGTWSDAFFESLLF